MAVSWELIDDTEEGFEKNKSNKDEPGSGHDTLYQHQPGTASKLVLLQREVRWTLRLANSTSTCFEVP